MIAGSYSNAGRFTGPNPVLWSTNMHDRRAPLLRAVPILDGDTLRIDAPFPDTQRARDAATNLREGVLTGLSVEFLRRKGNPKRGGIREILRAYVPRAGLVDTFRATPDSLVEVRAKLDTHRIITVARLSL